MNVLYGSLSPHIVIENSFFYPFYSKVQMLSMHSKKLAIIVQPL